MIFIVTDINVMCIVKIIFSSVSSALNSLAAVYLEDFVKPVSLSMNKQITDIQATWISKGLCE